MLILDVVVVVVVVVLVEVDVRVLHSCFGLCGLDVASIEYGSLVW